MKLNPQDLKKIASLTLDYYDQRAEEFWQGTRDHDVKQNIAALLQWIEGEPPFTILDFGCGPGRDLKVFSELGHIAVGLEGAARWIPWRVSGVLRMMTMAPSSPDVKRSGRVSWCGRTA